LPRGHGERCAGYYSSDREYAYCTRPEKAGTLSPRANTEPESYKHKVYGACNCGEEHNPARPSSYRSGDSPRQVAKKYPYYDEKGQLLYWINRYEPKDFRPCHYDEKGQLVFSMRGVRRVPYRLPELLKADKTLPVYKPEGEKDVDNVRALGLIATCNDGGAAKGNSGYNRKWTKEHSAFLRGRHVVLLPHNDEAGESDAANIALSLSDIAASVAILRLPGLPPGGDVSDWLAAGGTREELERLTKEAQAEQTSSIQSGVLYSEITTEPVNWLWQGYIPEGMITMLDGHPGLGKSNVTLDLAARVTQGDDMPDGSPGRAGGVILIAVEDDIRRTIRPRLEAAGADLDRVMDLSVIRRRVAGKIEEDQFVLPRDLPILEEAISRIGAALVVIDPLMAILDFNLKSISGQDVRRALTPLARLMERTQAACVIIRHLNKGESSNALLRGAGSMDIIGAARAGLLITEDPEDENKSVLAVPKQNLCKRPTSLTYEIVSDEFGRPRIKWLGKSEHSMSTLLSGAKPSENKQLILRALRDASPNTLTPQEIAEIAGIESEGTVRSLLNRMLKSGLILSPARSKYILPPSPPQQNKDIESGATTATTATMQQPQQVQQSETLQDDAPRNNGCNNHKTAIQAVLGSNVANVAVVAPLYDGDIPPPPDRECYRCGKRDWRKIGKRWQCACILAEVPA